MAHLLEESGPVLIARELAVPRSTLLRGARAGELVQVLPGTFLAAEIADDLRWRMVAVCRWRTDAIVCGAAVARLTFWPELAVDALDVAVRTPVRSAGFRFSRRVVPAEHCVQQGQVRTTSAALAAIDLTAVHGGEPLDRALRSRRLTLPMLWAALDACPDRAGNPERRRLLVESRAEPWSAAERLAHVEFRRRGLRGWVANHRVLVEGAVYFLDLAFRGASLAVEIDGYEHHSGRVPFEQDRARQNALVRAGWTVLRFTYAQLLSDPAEVVAMVRSVLRQCQNSQRSGRQS